MRRAHNFRIIDSLISITVIVFCWSRTRDERVARVVVTIAIVLCLLWVATARSVPTGLFISDSARSGTQCH